METIPYGRQQITDEDIAAVTAVLRSPYLTQGPEVLAFERDFANLVEAPFVTAVSNGTAALHLAVLALGLKPGDKVLCPAISFAASSNCALYAGADVEFVDIDLDTYCLSENHLREKLESQPGKYKGLIAVDYAGYPAITEGIFRLAKEHDLWILEDACHAPGARRKINGEWNSVGSARWSDISVFSFHPVKHISCGEGGMITTRSEQRHERLQLLRTHGITKDPQKMSRFDGPWFMEMQELGYNYRIPDILCALGRSQLRRFPENLQRRQKIAQHYKNSLSGLPLQLPISDTNCLHAFHLFTVLSEKRNQLVEFLHARKIMAQVLYIPIYQHPYYVKRYGQQSLANAENFYARALSLPMYHGLEDHQQEKVIESVREFHE